MKNLFKNLPKPIIGLAPMDGYTDSAFRQICKTINLDLLTYTEFTSADGLSHNAKKLLKKLQFKSSEKPILAQIFGKNTETFCRAAKICEDLGFDGIDLNMGCPAKKVVKSEHGIALRKMPKLAFQLIEAVANSTNLPVSVKTRLGWQDASDLITFGKGVEASGANMIAIHGRTYTNPYKVPANFEAIYELKEALNIPVLINGGITSFSDGLNKIGNTDGFLIGQAALGNPWVFSQNEPKNLADKFPLILQHTELMIEAKGELIATREMRKYLLLYLKGFPGAKLLREKIVSVESLEEIKNLLFNLIVSS